MSNDATMLFWKNNDVITTICMRQFVLLNRLNIKKFNPFWKWIDNLLHLLLYAALINTDAGNFLVLLSLCEGIPGSLFEKKKTW